MGGFRPGDEGALGQEVADLEAREEVEVIGGAGNSKFATLVSAPPGFGCLGPGNPQFPPPDMTQGSALVAREAMLSSAFQASHIAGIQSNRQQQDRHAQMTRGISCQSVTRASEVEE